MKPTSLIAIALVALGYTTITLASPVQGLETRAGDDCSSGIYGELAPILSAYPIAQAYCSAKYPIKNNPQIGKRIVTSTKSTPATTGATSTSDVKASAWAKCQRQGADVVSMMCSCILAPPKACHPKTTTAKTSTTTSRTNSQALTTKSKTTTSASSTTKTPIIATPIISTPVVTTPAITTPVITTQIITTPVITTPVITTPVITTPIIATPVITTSIVTTPLITTPVITTPVVTTATTTTSSASAAHTVNIPQCDPEQFNGGCSDNCSCNTDVNGTNYCFAEFSYEDSSITCETNDDCPQGDACEDLDTTRRCATGGGPGNECHYSASKKRSLFGGVGIVRSGRMYQRTRRNR